MPHPRFAAIDYDKQPLLVAWEMTQACALACRHCRAEAQPKAHPAQLSTAESQRLIDQVARAKPGIFIMAGGDPLMRRDCLELIEYAAAQGLHVAFSPSATPLLVRTDFVELKLAGVASMSLSLDGATREEHDAFRGVLGTWEHTMRAVAKAHQAGIPLQINTTLTRQNAHDFVSFAELITELKPAVWSVFLMVPTGRGQASDLPTAWQTERFFRQLHAFSETSDCIVKTTEGHQYRRMQIQQLLQGRHLSGKPSVSHGTRDGKGFVFVSHTGQIYPSGFLPLPCGNVREKELIDVYQNHDVFMQLRDSNQLKGKCGRCEFRSLCGGSRARAYAVTGDHMQADCLCPYQPQRGAEVNTDLSALGRSRFRRTTNRRPFLQS